MQTGKRKPVRESVETCLRWKEARSATPPLIKKYRNRPEPGAIKIHPGKADDPDVASTLVHGINTKTNLCAKSLVNPPKKTVFQKKLQEIHEEVYHSTRCAPLGRSGNRTYDGDTTIHGVKTRKDYDVREILYPPKTVEDLEKEALDGHKLYVFTHNSFFVGEKIDRKYDTSHFIKDSTFGIFTPHCKDGSSIRKTLSWLDDTEEIDSETDAMTKLYALNLSLDHTFGKVLPWDAFGVGEIIHNTEPWEFVRGPDQQRSMVSGLQNHLKRLNFHNFPSLVEAFKYYDKKGMGMIDREDLGSTCNQFQLQVSEQVLDDLMDYCDMDKDGKISFMEFANFLNWKDMTPIKPEEEQIITNEIQISSSAPADIGTESQELPAPQALVKPEDLQPVEPGSCLKTVRTLRQKKTDPDQFVTSSSNFVTLPNCQLAGICSYGTPTVRTDIPAPRLRSLGDTTNYGDSSTAGNLVNPPPRTLRGVLEEYYFYPRSKQEITEIFRKVGVNISEETFEEVWQLASMKHPDGEVCVEAFQNILKEMKIL
ncbi:EF-hand domain-containing family member B [Solea solea]|uniref:EF-hand domain-containing family member B n=1 Tax=Solea solea TaxID=90069 RepID=UPI00272D8664|nr:EF-hand domain-containing family member B [Solea solea]XP_058503853.1 EF-hand domain-containing family member B [Solea solea]